LLQFLSELEEDNEDEAPAEEGFAKGFGFGQSPGRYIAILTSLIRRSPNLVHLLICLA
jgi:hypothetical protein